MNAMVITRIAPLERNPDPLERIEIPVPEPAADEILIRVFVCGVCHTELDEIEGRLPPPHLPRVPGHQVVGRVAKTGKSVDRFCEGDRVGVAWIHSACGRCSFCRSGRENLCAAFCATGRDADGGYAEYMRVPAAFAYPLPGAFPDAAVAPLLCAGAVGYRSLRLADIEEGHALGLVGFGASAHLVIQAVRHFHPQILVAVFARDPEEREFALTLGAAWAGDITETPPFPLQAAIDTTPAWGPMMTALDCLAPGGRLVINAIRKEEIDKKTLLQLDYAKHLWMEKEIRTVANVTRKDVEVFLELAATIPIRPEVQEYPLEEANRALRELKQHKIRGAKVLRISVK